MDERTRFVLEHERKMYTMTELCEIYDIARETGYYWLRRYQQGGLEALQDRDRAPERHRNQTPEGTSTEPDRFIAASCVFLIFH